MNIGIDVFLRDKRFLGTKLALVTNQAAVTTKGIPGRLALLDCGFKVVKLFSPEHGLDAKGEDGAFQDHQTDQLTKLPVISLYGDRLAPASRDLSDVDLVLFDIPDIGCRFYTYLWTLTHVMESCAENGKPLLILDRPNPLSGNLDLVEGPFLDEGRCSSFIGRWSIPIRHSCTIGELARYFKPVKTPELTLEVLPLQGWERLWFHDETGIPFTPPSPAITDLHTALCYPGTGLLEGINVQEGRGTVLPFRMIGAPWIDEQKLQQAFSALNIAGLHSQACRFVPEWGLYAGEACGGLLLSVSNRSLFRPVRSGLALLSLLMQLYPQETGKRLYPTRANPSGEGHLDRLTGISGSFEKLKEGERLIQEDDYLKWEKLVRPFLLY
jgi:uncharacterized protein YbbC (DUF1343 family)